MKFLISSLIGLVLSVSVGAESLVEGRVRLSSGQPAAGVQVRLFDLTDLRRFVGTTTDETGHFALPLQAFSTDRGTALPDGFALGQNYPNPFNPATVIPYQIPAFAHVRLEVFNLLGQRLTTLVDAERSAGSHTAQWDATDAVGRPVGAGVYIYRLSSGGQTVSRRMVLVDGQAGRPASRGTPGPVRAEVEAVGRVYGLTVSGRGLVAYVDPTFRMGIDAASIEVEPYDGVPRMKLAAGGVLGDVNNDGQVDLSDVLLVMLYSADASITLPNNGAISLGDVNEDGQVNSADAVLLIRYLSDPFDPALSLKIGRTKVSRMYWTDWGTHKIQRADLDGSNVEDLVTTGLRYPAGIALDGINGKMYWTDSGTGKIRRADLDGSNIEDLVTTGLRNPVGIALDGINGKMYWTDSDTGKIQCADLDGSNVEDLVTRLNVPLGIALDGINGKMYWTDFGTDKIQRADLDGSNVEDLVVTGLANPFGIALDGINGKMYWTDVGTRKIQRANLDGSNVEDLVTGLDGPNGIALGP